MRRRALLASAAVGATAALSGCLGELLGDRVQETREQQFDLPSDTPVRVTNENGDVDVEPYDGAQVAVDALVTAPRESRLEDVTIEAPDVDNSLAVDVNTARDTNRVSVDLDVRVPDGTAIAEVQSQNGDVDVRGVASVDAARSANGDVTVRDAGPVSSVSTENGDVAVDVPAPLPGDVLVRTENGDVDAAISPGVNASLEGRTENGTVSVDGFGFDDASNDASGSSAQFSGTLDDGTHEVSVTTRNGDVEVRALE